MLIMLTLPACDCCSFLQPPMPIPAERELEEYFVYRVILIDGCISSETNGFSINLEDHPELNAKLIKDYNNINQESVPLILDLLAESSILISDTEQNEIFKDGAEEGWRRFHERYSCNALEEVSRVGFNAQMDEALGYHAFQAAPLSGMGEIILLVKGDDGKWKEENGWMVWIS